MDNATIRKQQRKNLWLRFLIDQKNIFILLVGFIGLIYIPLHIFPLITSNQTFVDNFEKMGISYTFLIFICQLIWIICMFTLIIYFLRPEKYRKKNAKTKKSNYEAHL